MPVPLLIAGIAAGSQLASQGLNAAMTGKMNRKNRNFAREMYGRQRADALADWQMEADYNSPQAQMRRLKEAGLNPNLVYGHGADATMGSMPRASSASVPQGQAPQFDLGGAVQSGISAYYNTQIQQAQVDNLKVQNELMHQEAKNKAAQEFKIYADTYLSRQRGDLTSTQQQLKGVDLNYSVKFKEMTLEGMRAAISKTLQDTELSKANTLYRLNENERQELKTGMTIREAAERILLMKKNEALVEAKTAISYVDRQNAMQRTLIYDRTIEKMKYDASQSKEKARILESTPDWNDQRAISVLENFLGGAIKPGSYLNPQTYRGWRK